MSQYNPDIHHRRSIRLKGYDYAQAGAYFVTICAFGKECLFGEVIGKEMSRNEYGEIVTTCWEGIPQHFPDVELDAFVVMPNHMHGIFVIINDVVGTTPVVVGAMPDVVGTTPVVARATPDVVGTTPVAVGATHALPLHGPKRRSVGAIVGSFKSAVSKRTNELRGAPGAAVWQRNYYEHIIRNENDLKRIRQYIANNPARWAEGENNPVRYP